MSIRKMIGTGLICLVILAPKAKASLSYEFHCEAVRQEQESSSLQIMISPDGADLMNLAFKGEIEESYSREEVSQFKFDSPLVGRTELFLFVKAAPGKSGPSYFRFSAKSSKKNELQGKLELLELMDLNFRVVHRSNYTCRLIL